MADTEKKLEALEQEAVAEASANPQADAPKKNAVAAEPSHIAKMNNSEDLGAAVVKPTDSNPDATKKTKQVSGDAQQKSQGAADPMPKLSGHNTKLESTETEEGSEEIKEGEMPKAALDALKKHKEKSEDKDAEDKKDVKDVKETEMPMKKDDKKEPMKAGYMKSSYKKEDIDVKEHVDALVAGENDLSEEFKSKAATIFESALKSQIKEIAESMEADYEEKLNKEIESKKEEMTEKVDSYLNYVVEEWMKENSLALERGIKGEIAEDFIGGLKKLFEDHYINVPDEKYNVLEDQASKIDELQKKLDESIEKNVELSKQSNKYKAEEIKMEAAKDLTETAKEKFNKLAEEVDYSTEADYRQKITTIKESYFKSKDVSGDGIDEVATGEETQNEDLSNAMAAYSAAISQTKNIKLSNK